MEEERDTGFMDGGRSSARNLCFEDTPFVLNTVLVSVRGRHQLVVVII